MSGSVYEKMFTLKQITKLPAGIHRYERGVYLRVTDKGRFWIFKYQIEGKRREIGLGGIDQPIAAILAKAEELRSAIRDGTDPKEKVVETKQVLRKSKKESQKRADMPTFEEYAPGAVDRIVYLRQFVGENTEYAWRRDVDILCRHLGDLPLNAITRSDIVKILEPLWTTHPRRARDFQSRAYGIFNLAKGDGWINRNPAEWKGNLDAVLPSPSLVRRTVPVKHYAALSADELKAIAQKLWNQETTAVMALLFGILTVGRKSEWLRGTWDEIDLAEKTFSVPPARRKDKKPTPHVVPLSRQAVSVLNRLDTSGKYLFQGRGTVPVGRDAVRNALASLTDSPSTIHGIRSTFSDWCARNDKNFLVSEKCLMHAVGNAVFQAYQRDDLLDQRRVLLQEWADFLLPDL